jgi:hypothetical protein
MRYICGVGKSSGVQFAALVVETAPPPSLPTSMCCELSGSIHRS